MEQQNVFPLSILTEGTEESQIKLNGQKVVFDKKVSLLPAEIKKYERREKK